VAVSQRSVRTRYVLAVLILAALTLVTIDARGSAGGVTSQIRDKFHDVFAPLQRATHAALQPIGNFLTGALDYGSLRHQNQVLRNQVAALQNQSIANAAQSAAAQQALAQQNLPFVGSIPTVEVQVIDDGFSNFENTVTVNKGTDSGVAIGEPVVASGGLVGSVQSVSAHTATIVLLTDPTFSVGVRLPGGNIGSASGLGRGVPLRVTVATTKLPAPKLAVGQAVVTSGLDLEAFPGNLPVGRVVSDVQTPNASEPDIGLRPLANLNNLTYLEVLLWSSQSP
jgi:rod shape-determining protein MreC